ncbi:30S ribosomal protein S5 [Patescibacteria group bacterium]|nr:MAG: 30S ribosomal protein S5 [Patescibacteria group bacterium]
MPFVRPAQGNINRERRRSVREAVGRREAESKEFDQVTLDLSRVTRVTKGGKRMRFRACVVVGDHHGRVGYGLAKGADVSVAINKAARQAQKRTISIPIINETIPHAVREKYGAAVVLLKPAPQGTGVKAGGAARVILELGGVPNVVSKLLGSKNKVNNVRATLKALQNLTLNIKEARAAREKKAAAAASEPS